jgi:hypothetical protein
MRYTVEAADKDTGESVVLEVDAATTAEATRIANGRGMLVERVVPVVPVVPMATRPVATVAPYPHPHIPPPAKTTNGLGVASLVLGIIGLLSAWVPVVGILALPVVGIGMLLALTRRGQRMEVL